MQHLVEGLLLLAKMDESSASGQPSRTPPFASVDLSTLVEGELLQLESMAFDRGVDLEESVESNLFVQGSQPQLARLVATLADNACKYAAVSSKVTVRLVAKGRFARLSVHNDGSFVSQEDLPHLFDRFYRADKARTGDASGHGLGLSIARAIAEEHGGTITADSSPESGTTFTVRLPLDQPAR